MNVLCYSFSNNRELIEVTWDSLNFYCERRGYTFKGLTETLEAQYKPHWNKIHYAVKFLQEEPSFDYFVWFDHDILIKNHDIKLEDIIKEYGFDKSSESFMLSEEVGSVDVPFNTGVIIFKNNKKVLEIFNSFLNGRGDPANYESGLQDTLAILDYFNKNKEDFCLVPHRVLQSCASGNHLNAYEKGDFCGHVSGAQGNSLLISMNDLINF